MKYFIRTRARLGAAAALLCAPLALRAQQPTPAPAVPANAPPPAQAAQVLQQAVTANPGVADMIRQRLQSSGMTPDQIRARLQAAGYSPTLLDSYLTAPVPGQAALTPGLSEAAAVQALGLPPVEVAVVNLPVDTGLVRIAQEAETPEDTTALTVFGSDVFKRSSTAFLPLMSGPVPEDYHIGPGDQLVLILTGDVETSYTLPVTREGFILIPQVGQVRVASLTLAQLREVLYSKLSRVYSGVRRGAGATTQFDVTVANVGAVQVYVVGDVTQPGAYQVSSLGTVLTGLYAAGGVTDRANTRHIELRRAGRVVAAFDLYDYLLRGDTRNDIRLETGDVLFVGLRGPRIEVHGAVLRPAIYEAAGHETLADIIAYAGGLSADAALQRISIERVVPPEARTPSGPQRVVVDVPLPAAGANGVVTIPPFPVEDGDIVSVHALSRALHDYVEIAGNVYQPGRFALSPGLTLAQLVAKAGGFKPATYRGRALVERLNPADSTRSVIAVELPKDSASPWPTDLPLADYDIVRIYSRPEMREEIRVSITGMVNHPGRYPWREGMTLRDLMLMAHGPKIGVDLREAEIARLPEDRSQGQMATTIRVPLDSTYLLDRDSAGRYLGPPGVPFAASGTPPVVLQPYDNVLIMRQPDFELQRVADIIGEVVHPGTYAITSKGERIADLIDRAGGLTPRAYPDGVRFIRTLGNAGRINIDLPRALRDRESRDNVILQPGDSITVPEYQPSVHILGAVNSPGSVLWVKGKGLGWYLDAAGGTARLAVEGRASVRQANGSVETRHKFLFWTRDPEPGPGSEIMVPARDPTDKTDWAAILGSLAQILTASLTLLVVSRRL